MVNGEGDTALAYFLTTYPRFSPSHLHKLFLNWRPCNNTTCKYNRHLDNITVTSQKDLLSDSINPATASSGTGAKQDDPFAGSSSTKSTTSGSNSSTGDTKKSASSVGSGPQLSLSESQKRMMAENPILARRGLQNRTGSLRLNVKEKGGAAGGYSNDFASSPVTPSTRLIANLKFGPIEVNSCSGLTPQVMQPQTAAAENYPSMHYQHQHQHHQQGVGSSTNTRKNTQNLSPFFPIPGQDRSQVMVSPTPPAGAGNPSEEQASPQCKCHLNKARLLWNTTFQASVFYLAKNWPCIVSSIMCSSGSNSSPPSPDELKFVDCNKLDAFVENLLANPYSVLMEVFLKTLMSRFLESKISENAKLLPSLHRKNPIDQRVFTGKTFNSLLPWLTVHRFVRSLVRQLSVGLSKNTLPDGSLKMKIGRRANKNNAKKEVKMRECLK